MNNFNQKIMKKILFSCFLLIIIFATNIYAQNDDPTKWKFFKVYVTTADDSIFLKLQDDMGIYPYLEAYTINIDIRSTDPKKKYLVLGDIDDASSVKFGWSQFREEVRTGLINWDKKNKMKIQE